MRSRTRWEAGFVAGNQRDGAGFIGQGLEGDCQLNADIETGQLFFQLGLLTNHLKIHERGFDGPEPEDAPVGGAGLRDQALLHAAGGPVGGYVVVEQTLEFIGILAGEQGGVVSGETVLQRIQRGRTYRRCKQRSYRSRARSEASSPVSGAAQIQNATVNIIVSGVVKALGANNLS